MSVITQRYTLQKVLRQLLFENDDNNLSLENSEEEEISFSELVPVNPSELMATQLAVDRPPVEDGDYTPVSSEELANAAHVLAKMIPPEMITKFYEELKRIVMELRGGITDDSSVNESTDAEMPKGGASLDDVAGEFGYASASGARQSIRKIIRQLSAVAKDVDQASLDQIRSGIATDFANVLSKAGIFDLEEAEFFIQNPQHVMELDSFRFYFSAAYLLPVYRQMEREASARILEQLPVTGISRKSHQTVLNFLLQKSDTDENSVAKKVERDAIKDGSSPTQASAIAAALTNALPELSTAAKLGGDIIALASQRYDSLSQSRKLAYARQAFEKMDG